MGNCTSSTTIEVINPTAPGHCGPIQVHTGQGERVNYYALTASQVPYAIQFINDTSNNYYFAVYQDFPTSPGLKSIAWQVRRLPKRGSIPTTSKVTWNMSYGIAIANWDQNEKGYTGTQQQDADLGNIYQALSDGDFPVIDPKPTGTTTASQIVFKNKTSNPMDLDMAFTVAGNIVAVQPKTNSGESVIFDVHPQYYVCLYRNIKLGQLVDSGVVVGPIKVGFTDGKTSIAVKAYMDNGAVKLEIVP